jgi:nucleoside-diphosphate-sugar epimerase
MRILITGATGHIGPSLIAELLRGGNVDRLFVTARRRSEPAASRVAGVERIARAQNAARGAGAGSGCSVVAVEVDSTAGALAISADDRARIRSEVDVIVHAAADTRFAAPLETLRTANVATTAAVVELAGSCPRLRQLLFVSTACVAGKRVGRIPEEALDDSAGFANAYERTKWEAEQVVIASGLPTRIARLTTCAGSHRTGYVHRFGALHHLLHWMSRGLVPMVPGTPATPIDIMSTDVAAAWLARAAGVEPPRVDICHVALGHDGIPLGLLLDAVAPLLDRTAGKRALRPLLVDQDVFGAFNEMVQLSGDALLARVQASAAAVLPSLLHPKVYETANAERCWGGPLPHADWQSMLSRVIAFGAERQWGFRAAAEACSA